MPRTPSTTPVRLLALTCAAAVLALLAAGVATAEPDRIGPPLLPAAERSLAPGVGSANASLESSRPAIAAGAPFGYTARVRAGSSISFLQVRLKVYRPSGRLIFQRTRIENSVAPGEREFHFERETDDLDLRPGRYPVELTVTTEGPQGKQEDVITAELRVYDPKTAPTDLVMVARLSGQPMVGPDGRFTVDPAEPNQALDELDRLLRASAEKDLRISLVVPPMLLEEWKRTSAGYELTGTEGPVEVPADSTVPLRYAGVLARLNEAMASGRVELLASGYSDPDLSELSAHGLRDDVRVQYQQGLSSLFASLESTPSTGSAPAGGCVPPAAVPQLSAEDLGYLVVEAKCVRRGDATVTAGVFQAVDTSMAVVVADARAGEAAALSDVATVTDLAFRRHSARTRAPFVFVAEIGPSSRGTTEGFVRTATELVAQPWLRQQLARDVATPGETQVRLVSAAPDRTVPADYWDAVRAGRQWATALSSATGEAQRETSVARTSSLIAEASSWSYAGWALAERGRAYAQTAEKAGRQALDPVGLSLQPITLAGTDGAIPVTISNGSDIPLTVVVSAVAGGNLRVVGDGELRMNLQPQENFFEVPVTLQNALAGELTVSVRAGERLLEQQTVQVRASYLDRLALIGGIVLILGGLLAYIIRRVRHAEARDRVQGDAGRYTESTHEASESDA